MILTFQQSDFTLNSGYYYSPSFQQEKNDTMISVQVQLTEAGTVILQGSVDNTTFIDITASAFDSGTSGLQQYIDLQYELYYRLKISKQPTSVKISL